MVSMPDYEAEAKADGKEFTGLGSITSKDYRKFIHLVDSDTEDEENGEEKPEKEEEKEEPIEPPTVWNCGICTFENPMSNSACDMCG